MTAVSKRSAGGESTEPRAPTVSVQGLSRQFASLTAVRELTFDVAPGELFGLVGPDGAGKTTTLRMLAGVLPPTSGTAVIHGVDVASNPERVKPHIAYMSQQFGLYQDLTVRENIEFYADLYRVPRAERPARMDRLYAFSNLGPFETRLAGNLSGGMKQKLSLSCALIHRPALLLLDEPTFGVDPISRRDLWLILHEMVGEGVTVLVSTSYLDEAERCDRVALLDGGATLALDSPDALRLRLPGEVFSLLTARPRDARDMLRPAPGIESASLFGDSVHVVVRPDAGGVRAIEEPLARAGIDIVEAAPVEASLEDVFIHLVGAAESGA